MKLEPFARVVNGLKIRDSVPFELKVWEKSPERSKAVGKELIVVDGEPWRSPSYPPKKKSFFARQMGPAKLPPNWLRWKMVRGRPARLLDHELASISEFRRKS